MKKINNQELMEIIGGMSLSGAIINAALSTGKFVYSIGQALGSSFRRIGSSNLCPMR